MDRLDKELNTYLLQQEMNESRVAREEPAMVEAAKREVDREIEENSMLFWDAMSYDAWHREDVLDEIRVAVYHGLTGRLGEIIYKACKEYLFNYHYEQIKDDWEDFIDE